MAVQLNQQDLSFILRQIRIAEAHASGIDLTELRVDPATGNLLSDRGLPPFGGPGLKLVHRRSRDDGRASRRY